MPTGAGLTFNVDSIRFDRAMALIREKLHIAPPQIVKDETRLLLAQIMRYTPPKTLAQGRAAVARDISRAMTPLDEDKFTSKKLQKIIRNKDVNAMREVVRRIPSMKQYTVETFDPVRLHKDKRDKRGRIQRSKQVFVLDKKGYKKYVQHEQKNVGSAKAGYWPGLAAVGGSVPSWVTRHANRFGSVDASKLYNPTTPSVRIQNFAYAARSQEDQTHSVESAVKMRARSMESKVRRMLVEIAKSSGLEARE